MLRRSNPRRRREKKAPGTNETRYQDRPDVGTILEVEADCRRNAAAGELGSVALRQVLDQGGPLRDFHGATVRRNDRKVLPTYHPAAGMRFPNVQSAMRKDFATIRREHSRLMERRDR